MTPRALILAAGFGTRLGGLSDELPKPALPVCDHPLVTWAAALLAAHGITEVAVNLHHHGDKIEAALAGAAALGVGVTWSREERILGTGGGLKKIAAWLTREGTMPGVVVNGKIVADLDLGEVLARHLARRPLATMVVRETADAARWGAIHVGEDERVSGILDQGRPGRACMFTGVHVVEPGLLARLPDGVSDSIRQAYIPALLDGDAIDAYRFAGYFHEHSTPARYLQGNVNVLRGRGGRRWPPGPLDGIDPTARVDAGARLTPPFRIGPGAIVAAGAEVGPDVVVGRGARVNSGARLERAVLLPGAAVSATLSEVIVGATGIYQGSDTDER